MENHTAIRDYNYEDNGAAWKNTPDVLKQKIQWWYNNVKTAHEQDQGRDMEVGVDMRAASALGW